MGDNGHQPDSIVPLPAEKPVELAEVYDHKSGMALLRQSIVKGWLEESTPKYKAAMACLDAAVRGKIEDITPCVRIKACACLLDVSKHVAEQLNPTGTAAQVAQAQQVVVNVNPDPDSPIAKMRAMWAEREADG